MGDFDDLLRRSFIAIATDHFDAEATFPPLDVQSEVAVIEGWLCSRYATTSNERIHADNPTRSLSRSQLT
jgi:hypothetical protein